MMKKEVTSLAEMTTQGCPVVEIPGWNGSKISVRLRKITLLGMMQAGVVPGDLVATVNEFLALAKKKDDPSKQDDVDYKRFNEMMHMAAKHALVEPTYDQIIKEVGCISDETLSAIWVYVCFGLNTLEGSFQAEGNAVEDRIDGKVLGKSAKRLPSRTGFFGKILRR